MKNKCFDHKNRQNLLLSRIAFKSILMVLSLSFSSCQTGEKTSISLAQNLQCEEIAKRITNPVVPEGESEPSTLSIIGKQTAKTAGIAIDASTVIVSGVVVIGAGAVLCGLANSCSKLPFAYVTSELVPVI